MLSALQVLQLIHTHNSPAKYSYLTDEETETQSVPVSASADQPTAVENIHKKLLLMCTA